MDKEYILEELTVAQTKIIELTNNIEESASYSRYRDNLRGYYESFFYGVRDLLGISGLNSVEIYRDLKQIDISEYQLKKINEMRNNPLYINMMGEYSVFKYRGKLEVLLKTRITARDSYAVNATTNYAAFKEDSELETDLKENNEKLDELFLDGKINIEDYNRNKIVLNNIYRYFLSLARGELIPYRSISNNEYDRIEKLAKENGISYDEQFDIINENLLNRYLEERKEMSKNREIRKKYNG